MVILLLALVTGCSTTPDHSTHAQRPFRFGSDTFAFENELVWEYYHDAAGQWRSYAVSPTPEYTLHCFVLARSARQFFLHARFDPALPRLTEPEYGKRVKQVVGRNPRAHSEEAAKILIPGFANLREFSAAHEDLLKRECGGAWQSYTQRGHWRMVLPFSRTHQARTADLLLAAMAGHEPLVLHLVRFPELTINHAVVAYEAAASPAGLAFKIYDPNDASGPATLTFDNASRSFQFPATRYWPGGRVVAYPVFHRWDY